MDLHLDRLGEYLDEYPEEPGQGGFDNERKVYQAFHICHRTEL